MLYLGEEIGCLGGLMCLVELERANVTLASSARLC